MNRESGQSLSALMVFMAMAIVMTTAATIVTLTNVLSTSKYTQGQEALSNAEAGIENALQRLLRDSSYLGETLTISDGSVIITVSPGASPKTITAEGRSGNFRRTITVVATYTTGNVLTVTSWTETP